MLGILPSIPTSPAVAARATVGGMHTPHEPDSPRCIDIPVSWPVAITLRMPHGAAVISHVPPAVVRCRSPLPARTSLRLVVLPELVR